MIEPGHYRARAISARLDEKKDKGFQVVVKFHFLESGEYLNWYGIMWGRTPESAERNEARVIQSLRYCGWKGNDLEDFDGISDNEVHLVVERSEWEGKVIARIAWVNSGNNFKTNPLTVDKRKEFVESMKTRIPFLYGTRTPSEFNNEALEGKAPDLEDVLF